MQNLAIQFLPNRTTNKLGRDEEIFYRFIGEVQQHFRTEHKLKFYADQLCITSKYMSKNIKSFSGRLPSEWIRDRLILEAKKMLHSGKYTVQQISDSLNFPNSSHFGKYFKQAVGCSPLQYLSL